MDLLRRIVRLLTHPSQAWRQSGHLLRYLWFRVRYGFVFNQSEVPSIGKDILIVNFTDWYPRAKTESLLVRHLHKQGYRPVVLTTRACGWTQRYYRLFGITTFLYFDDLVKETRTDKDHELAVAAAAAMHTTLDIFSFTFEGLPLGRSVLSTLVRLACRARLEPDDPETHASLITVLRDAIQSARAARTLFQSGSWEAVLFNEIGFIPYNAFFLCALEKNVQAIHYVQSQRLDAFIVKRHTSGRGIVDAVSLSEKSWNTVLQMPWSNEEEESFMRELCHHYEERDWFDLVLSEEKVHKSPEDVRRQIGLDPAKKTAVIFTHVVWDDSFFLGSNIFKDYDDWLIETLKVAVENTHIQWVIKLHPDYIWYVENMGMDASASMRDLVMVMGQLKELPSHIKVVPPDTDISTYSFFAVTDYCITARGTVGIEFPCFGVTTFTAGEGRYAHLGFTENSKTKEEYLEKMRRIHEYGPLSTEKRLLARRHAYALFVLRILLCPSLELVPIRKKKRVVRHEVVMHARSTADLDSDQGLRAFADWVLHSNDADYLTVT